MRQQGAAKQSGVRRVIYLAGLAATGARVSAHLESRHETGAVLREFGPALDELRAGIIVGTGSTSFEIIRVVGNPEVIHNFRIARSSPTSTLRCICCRTKGVTCKNVNNVISGFARSSLKGQMPQANGLFFE